MLPIFEDTCSPLYYSNDGRLEVIHTTHPEDLNIALPRKVWVVQDATGVVLSTHDRDVVDAYIAGYDFSTR